MFLRLLYQQKHCQLGLKGIVRGHNGERLSRLPTDSTHLREGDGKTEQRDLKILALKISGMFLQAKKPWQPSEAARVKEQIPS